jgi:small subunit ribosomal protein S13
MARVVGVEIPDNKTMKYALAYIKGVGLNNAIEIIEKLGLDPAMKPKDLSETDISKINTLLEQEYVVEGELNRRVTDNIKRLKEIGTYRGKRHAKSLPVRGQHTRRNARTRKGKKRTVSGVSVRKAVSKT